LLGHPCMLNSHLPFDKTEETKQQNRRFPQQHQALWEKRSSPPCMHPKSIIPYMQPMFHQKKIAAIVPLGLGLELCPSAMAKVQGSWRGGPAEPGHLPRSRQACLKGMVKWYWYLPIRNSLSYFSLTLSLSSLAPSSLHHS
jgi:hypothetical protein